MVLVCADRCHCGSPDLVTAISINFGERRLTNTRGSPALIVIESLCIPLQRLPPGIVSNSLHSGRSRCRRRGHSSSIHLNFGRCSTQPSSGLNRQQANDPSISISLPPGRHSNNGG
jgi:hypothetical protein